MKTTTGVYGYNEDFYKAYGDDIKGYLISEPMTLDEFQEKYKDTK